jgi:hypothetical protein
VEVPGRPLPAARGLSRRAASAARARGLAAAALATTLAAALVVVFAQPVRSPWWTYADADATYTASGLNLLRGEPVRYLDHPGLPLEQALAVTFAAGMLVDGELDRREYVDRMLLDLDRTRPVFRGLGIAFYLAGSLLAFALMARLFGSWTWGLAGGLLWLATPGLMVMAIQFRPDVPLAVLMLVVAYLTGRALDTRSAGLYGAAALTLGVAVMVKLHAAGFLPALVLAALWRPPEEGWAQALRAKTTTRARANRALVALAALAWLAVALAFNRDRIPFTPSAEMMTATIGPPVLLAVYFAAAFALRGTRWIGARRLVNPFVGFVGAAFVVGLLLPVSLTVPDGMRALVNVANGLTGRGISSGATFDLSLDRFASWPLLQTVPVFVLATVAAAVGLRRRDPRPVVWFAGALVLGLMAKSRLGSPHYFAPAFVVALPAALWVLRQWRRAGALLAVGVVAFSVLPQFWHLTDPATEATEVSMRYYDPPVAYVEERLEPGEVALAPRFSLVRDARYFDFVDFYAEYTPDYPYRFLSDSARAPGFASERGLRLRYYVGPLAETVEGTAPVRLGEAGEFTVRRVPGRQDVLELTAGPGVGAPAGSTE